jgi:hypothetical protein
MRSGDERTNLPDIYTISKLRKERMIFRLILNNYFENLGMSKFRNNFYQPNTIAKMFTYKNKFQEYKMQI